MHETLKKKAADKALSFIKNGMIIGLGTGSTTEFFIDGLIQKYKEGMNFKVVASSKRTEKKAVEGGLLLLDINDVDKIDIVVDGADEVDSKKNMIKGGGGALLREKILASTTNNLIIIIDETKYVEKLGKTKKTKKTKIPIEVIQYGYKYIMNKIKDVGFSEVCLRKINSKPFLTDNNNYIIDSFFSLEMKDLKKTEKELISIPGVVETGLFYDFDPKIIIAYSSSRVQIID